MMVTCSVVVLLQPSELFTQRLVALQELLVETLQVLTLLLIRRVFKLACFFRQL